MLGVHARRPMHDYLLPPIVFSSKKKKVTRRPKGTDSVAIQDNGYNWVF